MFLENMLSLSLICSIKTCLGSGNCVVLLLKDFLLSLSEVYESLFLSLIVIIYFIAFIFCFLPFIHTNFGLFHIRPPPNNIKIISSVFVTSMCKLFN